MKITQPKAQLDALYKGLKGAPGQMKREVFVAVDSSMQGIHGRTVQYAPYKTGNLRRSFTWLTDDEGDRIVGVIGTNLDYAWVQEFGMTIKAKRSKYLHFKGSHGWAKVKQVKIPGKHYFGRAIEAEIPAIRRRFDSLGKPKI